MSRLDVLRDEGLAPSDSDSSAQTVQSARIAPYVEDLFRWGKHSFGSRKLTKEIQATVRHPHHLIYIYRSNFHTFVSHLGRSLTRRLPPSRAMAQPAA